jgi:TfoX/Sxy family transcriptional regulator of competence genes
MSYDERIAVRVRALLGKRRDVVERKMFGGLTFMVNGAMCCGVTSEALVVRVGPADYERALAEPHARPMDFTGRPLVGMVYVDPPGYRTAPALSRWVQRGLDFVTHTHASPRPGTRTARRSPARPHSMRSGATKRARRLKQVDRR